KDETKKPKNPKDKQPGSQGFGRTPMDPLAVIDEIHELPEDKPRAFHQGDDEGGMDSGKEL
ncbi:hypothetical protein WDW86_14955, partial [Bdellovibrionota bacterium FG-2]